jgi:hypothetical protein
MYNRSRAGRLKRSQNLMSTALRPLGPRFRVGDSVVVTIPGRYRGQHGVITEVIEPHAGDFVYRYRALLSGNSSVKFFGFELQFEESSSGTTAA